METKTREELMKEAKSLNPFEFGDIIGVIDALVKMGKRGENVKIEANNHVFYSFQTEDEMYMQYFKMSKAEYLKKEAKRKAALKKEEAEEKEYVKQFKKKFNAEILKDWKEKAAKYFSATAFYEFLESVRREIDYAGNSKYMIDTLVKEVETTFAVLEASKNGDEKAKNVILESNQALIKSISFN